MLKHELKTFARLRESLLKIRLNASAETQWKADAMFTSQMSLPVGIDEIGIDENANKCFAISDRLPYRLTMQWRRINHATRAKIRRPILA